MKIGDVARRAGVTIDTIRFYERRGVLPAAARRPSGYRDYGEGTVRRLQLARRMQALGLTLDEIIDALAAHDAGRATCASERWRLDAALQRVDARIAELQALRREIAAARTACRRGRCRLLSERMTGRRRQAQQPPAAFGGHGRSPYEQKTQQSPGFGRSSDRHAGHSWK